MTWVRNPKENGGKVEIYLLATIANLVLIFVNIILGNPWWSFLHVGLSFLFFFLAAWECFPPD